MQHDVFISHASEDKKSVAEPLNALLTEAGLSVWLDIEQLTIGDSLRKAIDEGLKSSEYAVVILSSVFFSKPWAGRELDALLALEDDGGKRILPVLHEIDYKKLRDLSPIMAGKLAGTTADGLESLRDNILRVVRPAIAPREIPHSEVRHNLSKEAVEFLMAAAAGTGIIRITEPDYGILVNAGGKRFSDDSKSMARTKARYKDAINRELLMSGYLEQVGNSTTFQLKEKAFELYEKLKR